jgi:outer membrane immunogenic protein
MKRVVFAGAAFLMLAEAPGMAADMAVKSPVYKAPPSVVASSWTGFYVGANVGYSWGRSGNDWNIFSPSNAAAIAGATTCNTDGGGAAHAICWIGSDSDKLKGVIGGLQAGHNWQSGYFLAGIETDFQFSGQKGDQTFNSVAFAGAAAPATASLSATYTEKLLWLGTLRGRLGFTADRWLIYTTGGLAYGRVTINGSATATGNTFFADNVCGPIICPLASWSNSVTKAGWTIGAGVEGAISDNWSLKVEYLHVDLGQVSTTFATLHGCFGNAVVCSIQAAGTGAISSRVTDEIVRIGINYKFSGPVVASY